MKSTTGLILFLLLACARALSLGAQKPAKVAPASLSPSRREILGSFVPILATAIGVGNAQSAFADNLKDDPEFQACLSKCIYFCTKPKVESKSRSECLPGCKVECKAEKAAK
mmetsp:Transcript_35522/g.72380  ORF Transcript_35522/g.72380 Transcript_35522/m.72380 type:complete len:112 (+) Transcript_35522:64-399(+)